MEHENPNEEELKCPICEQTFVSEKSLFGHMRNHPERNWRGMKPPILMAKSECVSNDVLVRGWSKTGRRSRHGKAPMRIPASENGSSYDLVALANGELGKENLPPKKRRLELFVSSSDGNESWSTEKGMENDDKMANPEPESSKKMKGLLVVNEASLGIGKRTQNVDKLANLEPESSKKMKDLLVVNDASLIIGKGTQNVDKLANPELESSKKMKGLLVVNETSLSIGKRTQNVDGLANREPKSSKKMKDLLVVNDASLIIGKGTQNVDKLANPGLESSKKMKGLLVVNEANLSIGKRTQNVDGLANREPESSKKMKDLLVVNDASLIIGKGTQNVDKLANSEPESSKKLKDLLVIIDTSRIIGKGTYNIDKLANPEPESSKKKKDSLVVNDTRLDTGIGTENDDKKVNPMAKSSRKMKELLVVNDTIVSKTSRVKQQYVCDICARSFKSYQALGGHKAHHNSKADKIVGSIGEDDESSTIVADSVASLVHECPFCEKIFSKGQALGGHKRHCRGPGNQGNRGGEVNPDPPSVCGFDLNEFPPEWIPEEIETGEVMKNGEV
ncbi:hypothetical protein BUALT_Bualt13G0045200 [Buddleja alternifolia]|uniref:C2H2-type domain-containing protein n=1 Tax=Buddleja alternifolia TaxID=168488 RepID=A0AAV6WIU5_9LAMI|nr:hypothetical protein BUALT_Bualt13G0045200 [Buddleja alternifolia]